MLVTYTIEDGGQVVLRAKNRSLKDLAGSLKRPGQKALTVEEKDDAIGRAVIENDERSRSTCSADDRD